jgi:hypothetical protein
MRKLDRPPRDRIIHVQGYGAVVIVDDKVIATSPKLRFTQAWTRSQFNAYAGAKHWLTRTDLFP